jgi:molybdopterin converting factor subunit 1
LHITVHFFASIRERLRLSTASYELAEGATVEDIWMMLCRTYPSLVELGRSVSFAVNQEYVDREHRLSDKDEVAVIPPVSGGSE